MSRYHFSEEEKDFLKVAKLNQIQSAKLTSEITALNKSWSEINQSNDQFLSNIEQQLGISSGNNIEGSCSFIRESEHAAPSSWENLVSEANQEIDYDVDFEDLLNEEQFADAYRRVDEINAEFKEKTGLEGRDVAFLAVAIALQCARQYVLDPWLKKLRLAAGSGDEKGHKANKEAGWYYVDTDKILTNRVPFDVQQYGDNASIKGFLKGGDHRLKTLGHDPILGWIFGTANIMTGTVTRNDFVSAHVKCINNQNKIYSRADTVRVFSSVGERVFQEGLDGKIALGCAIAREGMHLASDVTTKRSLPIPLVGSLDPELGKKLAHYGIDTVSVGTEAALSSLINMIIAMVHRLYFDGEAEDEKFYEVKTRKILLYSNLIASTSNVIASVLTERYDLLDVGGLLVTISRLITDLRFICRVKDEFVHSRLDENFETISKETDALYRARFA